MKLEQRTISPAPDRRVHHPDGQLLEERTAVDWTPYWQRRLDDEDIELVADARSKKKDA